jgi:hypothetical protein
MQEGPRPKDEFIIGRLQFTGMFIQVRPPGRPARQGVVTTAHFG